MRNYLLLALLALIACGRSSEPQADVGLGVPDAQSTDAVQTAETPNPAGPDLATCPALRPSELEGLSRKYPLPVPKSFSTFLAANRSRYAIATLDGSTFCETTSGMERAWDFSLSADKRFIGFSWDGYEAFGYILIDRTGKGQSIDTGEQPTFSASRRRLASVDLSPSEFGGLNALGVWEILPSGLRQIANVTDAPNENDWRLDGWASESCLNLASLSWDRTNGLDEQAMKRVPREHWHADAKDRWKIAPGPCPRQ